MDHVVGRCPKTTPDPVPAFPPTMLTLKDVQCCLAFSGTEPWRGLTALVRMRYVRMYRSFGVIGAPHAPERLLSLALGKMVLP